MFTFGIASICGGPDKNNAGHAHHRRDHSARRGSLERQTEAVAKLAPWHLWPQVEARAPRRERPTDRQTLLTRATSSLQPEMRFVQRPHEWFAFERALALLAPWRRLNAGSTCQQWHRTKRCSCRPAREAHVRGVGTRPCGALTQPPGKQESARRVKSKAGVRCAHGVHPYAGEP